jgi:hypothetical protein
MVTDMPVNVRQQRGVVLMIVVVVLILGTIGFLMTNVSAKQSRLERMEYDRNVLKQAKQALMAYALTRASLNDLANPNYGDIGKMPCPDYNSSGNEGVQDTPCGMAFSNVLGYFPWKTLGIEVLKDSAGNCLLYAVSPAYKNSPIAALNPDSHGQFQLVNADATVTLGATPESRPVAVIIAPAATLAGQNRSYNGNSVCGDDYANWSAYLDDNGTTNNSAIDMDVENVIERFVERYTDSENQANPLNDTLIPITNTEFWSAINSLLLSPVSPTFNERMQALTEALALCISGFGSNSANHLPMPVYADLSGSLSVEYRRDANYSDGTDFTKNFAGRFPYNVANSKASVPGLHENVLFENGYCNSLIVTSVTGIAAIELSDSDDPYRQLWRNWKDHFLYVVSRPFAPTGSALCSGDCIKVGTTDYAAIIMFAGVKMGTQVRYSPPLDAAFAGDGNDKDEIGNYLEELRGDGFPHAHTDPPTNSIPFVFSPVSADPLVSNDIMFCIRPDMTVAWPC